MGLKAIALYRDGCKLSQPLSSKSEKSDSKIEAEREERREAETKATEAKKLETEKVEAAVVASRTVPQQMAWGPTLSPARRKLPARRSGFTQEATVSGHKVYIRTGEFEDGNLGEIFIDMHKE